MNFDLTDIMRIETTKYVPHFVCQRNTKLMWNINCTSYALEHPINQNIHLYTKSLWVKHIFATTSISILN